MGSGNLLNQPISLTQLIQPKVFLNALRQQTARVSKQAIGSLKLVAAWNPGLVKAPVKVTVQGMLLQGCTFEGNQLSRLRQDSGLFLPLPDVTLAYIPEDHPEPYNRNALAIPVYVGASREEFVAEIKMPCSGDTESWIL